MTITTTKNRINQTADGIQTIFIYDFIVLDAAHMFPLFNDVVQGAGFTVNGVGNPAGGDVTFDVPPANGVTVTLARIVPFTQLVDYVPYDPFPAETHEGALDKLTLITQQIEDSIARSLQLPLSTEAGNLTLPEPIPLNFLQWNNAGDGLINVTIVDIGVLIVTPFAETLLDDPDADTFWATLMATITKLTARSTLGAAGLIDANTFTGANTFDGINIFNALNTFNAASIFNALSTFNEKAVFNKVMHQQIGSDIPSAAALPNTTDGNYAHVTELAAVIIGATQANPVVITAVAHGLSNGDEVTLANVGGMIELNGIEYTVANITTDTFELTGIDGTLFTAYTTGGEIWAKILSIITTGEIGTIIQREFDGVLTLAHDATNLNLFGLDITTAAGDVITLMEYASGDFKLLNYTREDGTPFIPDGFLASPMFPTHIVGNYQLGASVDKKVFNQNSTYTKRGEAIIKQSGTVRVSISGWTTVVKGNNGKLKIYKNGIAIGTERIIGESTVGQWEEDVAVVVDDLIQIYMGSQSGITDLVGIMQILVDDVSVLQVGVDPTL